MSTIVVGGGLMGLTTAQVLLGRGEPVTVLELLDGIALETSYANGGLLTPSMPEPWNGPGVLRHLASSLFNPRAPMKLRLRASPSLTGWGLRFLQYSSQRHHDAACAANYELAAYSLAETRAITTRLGLEYCHAMKGTLSVFRRREDFAAKESVCRIAGDLGMRSPDGYITLQGRGKELIISGGFNIYPREVEEFLTKLPGVREAAVKGVPDTLKGERPLAFVVMDEGAEPDGLEAACREGLASFKVPKAFVKVEALPRNALGKVQKHLLGEIAKA